MTALDKHSVVFLIPSSPHDNLYPGFFKVGYVGFVADGSSALAGQDDEVHAYRTFEIQGPALTQAQIENCLLEVKAGFDPNALYLSEFRAILHPDDLAKYNTAMVAREVVVLTPNKVVVER